MDRRFVGIALILAGITMMGLIVYFVFFHSYGDDVVIEPDVKQVATTTENLAPIKIADAVPVNNETVESVDPLVAIKNNASSEQKTPPSADELERILISNLGKSFVERFGSFSNQSDFGNISDLEMFMSVKMKDWAQKEVARLRAQTRGGEIYYGVTTKVVGYSFSAYDKTSGIAEMVMQARRRETNDKAVNSYNQNIVVKFTKEDGVWLVASADWQEGKE